jgi:hypothetical protein
MGTITAVGSPLSLETIWISVLAFVMLLKSTTHRQG